MENLVKFKVEDKPLICSAKFPYEDVIKSLKVLDRTKAIVFTDKEIKAGNVYMLRKLATKLGLGYIKRGKKGDKTYLWLPDREESL